MRLALAFFDRLIEKLTQRRVAQFRKQVDLPIRLRLPSGQVLDMGQFDIPKVTVTVHDARVLKKMDLDTLGTAYVEGLIDLDGDLTDIIEQGYALAAHWDGSQTRAVFYHRHSRQDDKNAIQYHYDVSNEFYQLWLDPRMLYSCAYFAQGEEDLATAQLQKLDHILQKIRLAPHQRLLDIGCGWGGLVIRAAQRFGVRCVGVTLSTNQFALATERVKAAGVAHLVEIRLQDYRELDPAREGTFDRITSVGMFEHVGRKNLPEYFAKIASLLSDEGVVMNHGITSTDAFSGETQLGAGRFIDRYVFPEGELPHLSLVVQTMQQGGLEVFDVENLRRHYAKTCGFWASTFEQHGAQIRAMIGEKRYRIWRVYLAGCARAFEVDQIALYQVVCQKAGRTSTQLPWSREYIYAQK